MVLGAARHPTQLYFAAAALLMAALIGLLSRPRLPAGALMTAYVAANGLATLLLDPLRADAPLLPGGVRLNQVVGLGLLLAAAWWARSHLAAEPREPRAAGPEHARP